jgi:hypothetical protein
MHESNPRTEFPPETESVGRALGYECLYPQEKYLGLHKHSRVVVSIYDAETHTQILAESCDEGTHSLELLVQRYGAFVARCNALLGEVGARLYGRIVRSESAGPTKVDRTVALLE